MAWRAVKKYKVRTQVAYRTPAQKRRGVAQKYNGVIEAPGWQEFWCPHNHKSEELALRCAERELERVRRFGLK